MYPGGGTIAMGVSKCVRAWRFIRFPVRPQGFFSGWGETPSLRVGFGICSPCKTSTTPAYASLPPSSRTSCFGIASLRAPSRSPAVALFLCSYAWLRWCAHGAPELSVLDRLSDLGILLRNLLRVGRWSTWTSDS